MTDLFLKTTVKNAQWFICCRFYKIDLFEEITFPQGKRYEDLIIIPLLYLKANTVFSSDKALYNYFKHVGSITNSANIHDLNDMFYAARIFDQFCTNKDISEFFRLVVVSNAFNQCYRLHKENSLKKQAVILNRKTGINYNTCLLKIFMSVTLSYSKEIFKKSIENLIKLFHYYKRRNI